MKKLLISAMIALSLFCGAVASKPMPEPQVRTMPGQYYACGEVVTEDGNAWGYTSEAIDHECLVYVVFNDAGTPDNIYDDEIIELIAR